MRIAVCDDLPEILEDVRRMLEQIPDVKYADTFSDMDEFYREIESGEYYDAVLMDIDWKREKTGIDFANDLYKYSPGTQIVYITAYTMEYVEDVFLGTSNLSGFLMKPVKFDALVKNLQKVKKRREDSEGKLVFRFKGNVMAIPFQDIIYLESQLHKVNIAGGNDP